MSGNVLQDVLVGFAALAAGVLVLRRVVGVARPEAGPKCTSCPDGGGACATDPLVRTPAASQAHPLVVVRDASRR